MKKILSILLAGVLCFGLIPMGAFAEGTPTISANTVTGEPGDEVNVVLTMSNNPGIVGVNLQIGYGSDLTLLGRTNGTAMSGDSVTTTFGQYYTDNPYTAIWLSTASENHTDNGTLLTLKFKISDTAVSGTVAPVTVTCVEAYDVNFTPVSFTTVSGAVNVIQKHTVTFKDWDNRVIKTELVEHGQSATAPTGLNRVGYDFVGWDKAFNNVVADLVVTATYSIKSYDINYYVDSVLYDTQTYEYGSVVTAIAEPVRTGYVFSGWSQLPETMPAYDVRIDGSFFNSTYTVTFVDGLTHNTISQISVNHGDDAVMPTAPEHADYDFTGWSHNGKNITSDMTITANYAIKTFTVTFVDHDGEVLKIDNVEIHGNATPPTTPERRFYEFSGWSGEYTNVTSNRTVTATYTILPNAPQYVTSVTDGAEGETVTVTVELKNNPGIVAGILTIAWDAEVVELISAENGNVISGEDVTFTKAPTVASNPYTVSWVSTATEDYTADGVMATFTFKIKDGAADGEFSVIDITNVETLDLELSRVEVLAADGRIDVLNVVLGDVSGDDVVTTADAMLILRYLTGWEIDVDPRAADINGDGDVTTADAMLILRYLTGWEVPYFN